MQTTAVAVPVRDTGDALKASLTGALNTLFAAIPRVLGFAVVLIIGWIISSLLARGVQALLHAVRFNDLARRSGLADFVHKMGVKDDSSAVLAAAMAAQSGSCPGGAGNRRAGGQGAFTAGARSLGRGRVHQSRHAGRGNPGCRLGLYHHRSGQSVGHSHHAHQHFIGRHCGRAGTCLRPCLRAGWTRSCRADPRSGRPQSGARRAQAGAGSGCGSPSDRGHGAAGSGHGAPYPGRACLQRRSREWLDRAGNRRSSAGGPPGNSGPAQRRHQFVSLHVTGTRGHPTVASLRLPPKSG
jgi:hypothetical protein